MAARGGVDVIIARMFTRVASSPQQVLNRLGFMPAVIESLRCDAEYHDVLRLRVRVLVEMTEANYARAASRVNSNAVDLEYAIVKTRDASRIRWLSGAYFTRAFSAVPQNAELIARNLDHLKVMTAVHLDIELVNEYRRCFGGDASVSDLRIPDYPEGSPTDDSDALVSEATNRTLYYIAGAALPALWKLSERCLKTNAAFSALLVSFVSSNSLTSAAATMEGLPTGLVSDRNKAALIFASSAFFRIILLLEFAYSSLLTMSNVISFGGSIVKKVRILTSGWSLLRTAFDLATAESRRHAESLGIRFDGTPQLTKLLQLYMRIRGADVVKTIVGELKQSTRANTHRGKMAAAAEHGRSKQQQHSKRRDEALVAGVDESVLEAEEDMEEEGEQEDEDPHVLDFTA